MQLILTPPPKVMVILKEISFNCGSPAEEVKNLKKHRKQLKEEL